ncbi:hypothetical protein Tco_0545832, partial [Tanacetum coccineum]
MEGLINEDVESNNKGWKSWDDFEITKSDHYEWEYKKEHEDDERYGLCGNETHEFLVCTDLAAKNDMKLVNLKYQSSESL